ncbi:MAG: CinA family nicotinamide mononucleotide deamidase-related protein [Deltaproteobacteria bacterium]|nr:CinA family nicotinamide mononucleotide deamidase-related protein [Deltaproteobacteria bacterium]
MATSIEIVSVGDEVTGGAVVDSNAAFISETLGALGFETRWHTAVRDVVADIVAALQAAVARADAVVVGGGLGPTADDLTAGAAAKALGVPLERHAPTLERMRERFRAFGLTLTANNERQADVPRGADVIENRWGTAPSFSVELSGRPVFFLPGVPRELRPLVTKEIAPRLAARFKTPPRLLRVYKLMGIAESHLDARVADLHAAFPTCRFLFRTLFPENHLRVVIDAETPSARDDLRARIDAVVADRFPDFLYGHDTDTFVGVLQRELEARGETIAIAESCTGGLLGSLWTERPGASRTFRGGVIAYANDLKSGLLGVDKNVIAAEGAVSEAVARAMANGVCARSGATYGLAVTGVAGPDGGTPEKPVGLVHVAVSSRAGETSRARTFPGDREQVRRLGAYMALQLLWDFLRKAPRP